MPAAHLDRGQPLGIEHQLRRDALEAEAGPNHFPIGPGPARHRLHRRLTQARRAQAMSDRPDEGRARTQRHAALAGQAQRPAIGRAQLDGQVPPRRQRVMAHMVVDEHEALHFRHRRARRPQRDARQRAIGRIEGPIHRQHRLARRERRAEVAHQLMQRAQPSPRRPDLAVLAQRRLEVVAPLRHVVGITGRLRLVERPRLADRVGAAVIHVIAVQVGARPQLDQRRRMHVVGAHDRAAVVALRHAAASLGQAERVMRRIDQPRGRRAVDIAHLADHATGVEQEHARRRQRFARALPEPVGVGARHRQHLARRDVQRRPAGDGVDRHGEADVDRQLLQRGDVLGAAARTGAAVFVLQLQPDHRPAVAPQPAARLRRDLAVEPAHVGEVGGIVAARLAGRGEPVGKAAQPHLGMHPRTGTQVDEQAGLGREVDEARQVALAVPAPAPLHRLVVVPDHVAGDDVHPARLDLGELARPFVLGIAAVVELAHHRHPGPAVQHQVAAVDLEAAGGMRVQAQVEEAGLGRRHRRGHL